MNKHFKLVVLISLFLLSVGGRDLFASDPETKETSAFEKVVQKMYGKDAKAMEDSVKSMHAKRDARINSAVGEDTLDYEVKDVQKNAQAVLEMAKKLVPGSDQDTAKKRDMMKQSLSPELKQLLNLQTAEGEELTNEEAIQLGLRQQLEILRDKSQYEVENLLKLQLIIDPNDQENIFVKYPWIIPYTATVVRDKDAIPSLFDIWFKKKGTITIFFVFVIFTFFLSKFISKLYNRNVSTLVAIIRFFVRLFTMFSLRIICFVYLFYEQLGPIGKVTKTFIFTTFKDKI